MRRNRIDYFLDMADVCAFQGTCRRRLFGAVIVDNSGTVISTGYNGAPRHIDDCTKIGKCWRQDHDIPSGQRYESCRSVHAEMNACIQAGRAARGSTLYLSGRDAVTREIVEIMPCFLCAKIILNAEIDSVVMRTKNGYLKLRPTEIHQHREKEALS